MRRFSFSAPQAIISRCARPPLFTVGSTRTDLSHGGCLAPHAAAAWRSCSAGPSSSPPSPPPPPSGPSPPSGNEATSDEPTATPASQLITWAATPLGADGHPLVLPAVPTSPRATPAFDIAAYFTNARTNTAASASASASSSSAPSTATPPGPAAVTASVDGSASIGSESGGSSASGISAEEIDARWLSIKHSLRSLGGFSSRCTVTPYRDTGVAFEEMWKAVDSATHSVTWHTYIAKDDHVGKETLRRLVAAARRGCRVQFLYDCAGNISGRDALVKPLIEAGGEVVRFRPFFRSFLPWLAGGAHWRKSPAMRTHRKILVVDDRVAFTGGLNVGNEYAGPQVGGSGRFRDSHCRVDDPESVFFLARACRDTIEPGTATRAPASRMRWRRWAEREATVRAHMVRTIADRIVASGAAPKFSHAKGRVSSAFARQMRLLQLQRARLAAAAAHGQGAGAKAARRVREVAGKVRVAVTPRTSTSAAPSEAETTAGAAQPTSNTSGSSSGTAVPSKAEANAATAELLERAAADEAKSGGQYKLTEDRAHPDLAERIVSRARDAIHGGGETLARVLDHVQVEVQQARIIQAQQGLLSRDPTAAAFDRALIAKGVDAKIRAQLQRNVVVVRVGPDNNGHMHALAVPAVGTTQILLCNPFSRNWGLQMALWHAVQRSACRVWVTTPYLLPHRRLYQAMVSAAKRGVDVRVLTGSNTTMDPWFMWYAQQYMTHRLLAAGVRLYEYDGGAIMHAKTVVVDGTWAVVGSYNWDLLSNKLCEAAAAALDPGVARTVEQHFAVDCSLSRPITADVFASRSWWVRLMCVLTYNGLKVAEYLSFWRYTDYDLTSKID